MFATCVDNYRQLVLQHLNFLDIIIFMVFYLVQELEVKIQVKKQRTTDLEMVAQLAKRIDDFE